ncbi:MAG: hypothetical protein LBV64_00910 [Mediterranea sp.]|nr:hypothetical protein [Mediterranea sp.]
MKKGLTNEEIVRVLERAKDIHAEKEGRSFYNGLCFNLEDALNEETGEEDVCPDNIADYIPMFNKAFLGCEHVKDEDFNGYWWKYDDHEVRYAALWKYQLNNALFLSWSGILKDCRLFHQSKDFLHI